MAKNPASSDYLYYLRINSPGFSGDCAPGTSLFNVSPGADFSSLDPSETEPDDEYDRVQRIFGNKTHIRRDDFPSFHQHLVDSGRDDLSWKMNACMMDAVRVDCRNSPYQHDFKHPIPCLRRTCPGCGKKMMSRAIARFSPYIDNIWEKREKACESPRVRMWTWTCRHGPDLRDSLVRLGKALRSWWRTTHGDHSPHQGTAGGLICMEVGKSGNAHAHGIIDGPFLSAKFSRLKWKRALQNAGLSGSRLHIQPIHDHGAVAEVIAYPLDPGKLTSIPETLIADVEMALSGHHSRSSSSGAEIPGISSIRRLWTCGRWSLAFPNHLPHGECPKCGSGLTRDRDLNDILGPSFLRDFFNPDEQGESAISNQREFTNRRKK